MRKLLIGIVMVAGLGVACKSKPKLLGRWEMISAHRATKNILEFRPDGSMTATSRANLDFTYSMQGNNHLTLTSKNPMTGDTRDDNFDLALQGDTMSLKDTRNGQERTMVRIAKGASATPPILGTWKDDALHGGKVTMEFAPDGHVRLDMLMNSASGKYTIAGDTLTVSMAGAATQTAKFQVQGDEATFVAEKGGQQKYRRLHN